MKPSAKRRDALSERLISISDGLYEIAAEARNGQYGWGNERMVNWICGGAALSLTLLAKELRPDAH